MVISNLTVSAPSGADNAVQLTTAGTNVPLRILNAFSLMAGGVLTISNGAVQVETVSDDGDILLNSPTARLGNTNGILRVGDVARGMMTVSNGTVLTATASVGVGAGSQGTLTIAGGTNVVSGVLVIGYLASATGTVWVTGGQLTVTNNVLVGNFGVGRMTMSNGTWLADLAFVGTQSGSQGTLTVAGGTNALSSHLYIGSSANATGAVWVTGGQLSNVATFLGNGGVGRMTVSNGTWLASSTTTLGVGSGSRGTLTVAGGTSVLSGAFRAGDFAGATGTVWVTGGQLMTTNNSPSYIGFNGVGQMAVSNGTWLARNVYVGFNAGAQGTLTVAGGTNSIYLSLNLGDFPCAPTGTVVVTGGDLFVTNAAGNAVLEVRTGSVTLNSGTLVIDRLILTNACGRFIHTGGALSITTTNLPPSLDADGDSMSNASDPDPFNPDDDGDGLPGDWEIAYGLDPFDPTGANGAAGDPDGDGLSNLAEYLGGTDPTTPSPNPDANSWDFSLSSIWEMNNRWSLNSRPSLSDPADWITNAFTKTVTLASSAQTSSLTITNLTVQGFGAGTNTLLVTTTNTLVILNHFAVGTNAFVIVSNSNLRVDGKLGGNFLIDGTVTNDGGSIVAMSNLTITVIGDNSRGSLTMRAGKMLNRDVVIGHNTGAAGTLTIAGGTNSISSSLTLGTFDCTATGIVNVTGGTLAVTNATTNAVLDVHSGTVTLSSGTLTIDKLVITNGCGHLIRTGGTLAITTTNLAANLDADGDGMNNNFEQTYGLDPFNPADASGDPDGDGYTNLQEFNVGTNPTDAGSNPGVNSWTNSVSGKWEVGANWLLTIPPASNQTVLVTNATTKVVTIDATTTNTPATMTITNLTVAGPAGTINTLQLSNAGTNVPLRILNTATISSGGALLVTNSTLRIEGGALTVNAATGNASLTVRSNGTVAGVGSMTIGGGVNSTGTVVVVTGGKLVITNNPALFGAGSGFIVDGSVVLTNGSSLVVSNVRTFIGYRGSGSLTNFGGTMILSDLFVGHDAGSQGTLTIAGGTNELSSLMNVGEDPNATGTVWVTGGRLLINILNYVGRGGVGRMTVSNGTWLTDNVYVGRLAGSQGTLTVANTGTAAIGPLKVGGFAGSTGTVWVTGGQLVVTNNPALVGAGSGFVVDGPVTLTNGSSIVVSNVNTIIGNVGSGSLTNFGGSMSVPNLIVGNLSGSRGTITQAGGTITTFAGRLVLGNLSGSTGTTWITDSSATLMLTNDGGGISMVIGSNGVGQVTVSNGTCRMTGDAQVGYAAGSQGTLTVAGGTVDIRDLGELVVGTSSDSTGTVWMTGSTALLTGSGATIGHNGRGQMIVSNGTWLANGSVHVGNDTGQGTLTIAGGTNHLDSSLVIGGFATGTGTIWMTGGQLTVTNNTTYISSLGVGQMTVSNGTWLARNVILGNFGNGRGTLTIAGGTSSVFSNLTIGNFPCAPTGTVVVAGGNFFVTNASASAVLEVRTGSVIVNSGALMVDNLVITNACGHFIQTGGALSITTTNIAANLDADGDGLPNSWETSYGFSPFSDTGNDGASGDPDGDGFTNLQEFNAGTNPNDAGSNPTSFRITAIVRESNNIRVTWQFPASKTNALQATAGGVGGSYSTNGFADIFTVTNTAGTATNYLDVGGATNFPSRYYRIRLVP